MDTTVTKDVFFKNIKSIIFDFDGTIADTINIHDLAFKKTLQNYECTFEYANYLGQTTETTISQILAKNNLHLPHLELQELVKTKRRIANELIQTHSKFIDGAFEFITFLQTKNMPMYIASSGSKKNVFAGIEALKITNYFKAVITADDIQYSKPHPEIFNKIIDQQQLTKVETLVIEDALSGIEAAINANLKVVCINPLLNVEQYKNNNVLKISFQQLINRFNTN